MTTKFAQLQTKIALGVPTPGQLGNTSLQSPAAPAPPPDPAAQGAAQPAPDPSSAGAGPAPANIPPQNVMGQGSAPQVPGAGGPLPGSELAGIEAADQAAEAEAARAELRAKQIDTQAKIVGAKAKEETSGTKLLQNQAKLQEAQLKAQQLKAQMGSPVATATGAQPAGGADRIRAMMKAGKIRAPYTVKQARVKVALHAAKIRKYGEYRAAMSDGSAMAEPLFRDIPHDLVKSGFELDPLTEIDPRLIAFGLESEGSGKMLDMIHQRQHGRLRWWHL